MAAGWRGLPDLTARAESSVDTAGPGWQASRTCPPRPVRPRAGGGRSAPAAAARDPHRRRPRHPLPHCPERIRAAACADAAGPPRRIREAGLTAWPEPSGGGSGPHGQAPPAGTHRSRPRPRRPGRRTTAPGTDELLTIEEVIAELRVSRATFYRWRRRGTGPAAVRLPGGGVRIRRSALDAVAAPPRTPPQEEHAA